MRRMVALVVGVAGGAITYAFLTSSDLAVAVGAVLAVAVWHEVVDQVRHPCRTCFTGGSNACGGR